MMAGAGWTDVVFFGRRLCVGGLVCARSVLLLPFLPCEV